MIVPDEPQQDPVSLHKGAAPEHAQQNEPLDFDPYRFGAPDHPIPPEYAPPGYTPPPPTQQPYQYQQPPRFPQYPPPPPQLGWGGPPRQANPHGKAVASLVLGIASIVLCWLTILDALPVVIALVLGLIALRDSKQTPNREGHGLALAGVICAIIGAVLAIALSVLVYTRFSACLNLNPGSSDYTTCIQNHL